MTALELSQHLIRCPSITPLEGGALALLETELVSLGFTCTRLDSGPVANLHARIGTSGPHLGFAGHTDVVPLGDANAWSVDPFGGIVKDDILWGRGSADMKCAIACFVSALKTYLDSTPLKGSISLIITGDEEGDATHGTVAMLPWMKDHGHIPDLCLIGEPASTSSPGDKIKIGRRGSVRGHLVCHGVQGHIAYPQKADNPIPRMLKTLTALSSHVLDEGSEHFESSQLQITTVDVGNPASNVTPAHIEARFGIRFNTHHSGSSLKTWMESVCAEYAGSHTLEVTLGAEPFLTDDTVAIERISKAIEASTGTRPDLSTRGGTSDGRFLIHHCPVIECGMTEEMIHKVDEHVPLSHIEALEGIYLSILKGWF